MERRKNRRTHDDSRIRARAVEFAGIAVVACVLAASAFVLVEQAFAGPLRHVQAALGR